MRNFRTKLRSSRNRSDHAMQAASASTLPASDTARQDEVNSLLRERLDLHAELFEAAQIQRKLSGPRVLQCGDLQFASEVFAARRIPGDFAVLSRSDSMVFATLGDIAGKGFAAGMWFTNLAGLLQDHGRPVRGPEETASEINLHLYALRPVAPFVTAFIAQMDCALGLLTYCNAGHFPPILLSADGQTKLLATGGPLLGAIEQATFEAEKVRFSAGDVLVVYSDGVLECRGRSGEEFGMERLLHAVRESKQPTAHATLMTLLAIVQDFERKSAY